MVPKQLASCMEKMVLTLILPHTHINSRWIICLNVKTKAIKFLEEETGKYLHDLGIAKIFLFFFWFNFYFYLLQTQRKFARVVQRVSCISLNLLLTSQDYQNHEINTGIVDTINGISYSNITSFPPLMSFFFSRILYMIPHCIWLLFLPTPQYLFIWLQWVLVAACGIFSCGMLTLSCGMWDLFT